MAPFAALTLALTLVAVLGPGDGAIAAEPAAEPSGASPSDGDREAAKQAFDRGLTAVAEGEYEVAVAAFERAYRLRPHPVTLFNLALALEKAGRLPEAWELFDDVIDIVESDAERREVRRHMRAIANQIAIVEIDAQPRTRLCLDGVAMPAGDASAYRLAVVPGRHQLLLDEHAIELEFVAGDRRVLLLSAADALIPGRKRGPWVPAMLGVTIGGGALAIGLGVGAAVSNDDPTRVGLSVGAATSAGIAAAAGVVALLIETRRIPEPTRRRDRGALACPGAAPIEPRLDLELGPTIARPVEFAQGSPPMPMPMPMPMPLALTPPTPAGDSSDAALRVPAIAPRLRSIAPPRVNAQKRPTTTSPI